jgi:hypothetical protein
MGKAFTCHTKRREGKEVAIIFILANRGMGVAEPNPTTIKKHSFLNHFYWCCYITVDPATPEP